MEAAKRASLADEEACRMRGVELAAEASNSKNVEIARGTADIVVAAKDTIEGFHIKVVVGSEEPDPPSW